MPVTALPRRPLRRLLAAATAAALLGSGLTGVPLASAAQEGATASSATIPNDTPTLLSYPYRKAYHPAVVTTQGAAVVAWGEQSVGIGIRKVDLHRQVVHEPSYRGGENGNWYQPRIAADGATVAVTWSQMVDEPEAPGGDGRTHLDAWVVTSRDGGETFTPLHRLPGGDAAAWEPRVDVHGSTIAVAWHQGGLRLAVSSDGGTTWSQTEVAAQADPHVLDVAVDDGGVAHVFFVDGTRRIAVWRGTAAGPLDATAPVAPLTGPGQRAVTIDAAHTTGPRVFAAYEIEVPAGDPKPVFLAHSDDRWATYDDPAVNEAPEVCTEGCSPAPRLVTLGDQATVAYADRTGVRVRTTSGATAALGGPTSTGLLPGSYGHDVAVTDAGTFVTSFGYSAATGNATDVYTAVRPRGAKAFDAARNASSSPGDSFWPAVTADEMQSLVVWDEAPDHLVGEPGGYQVRASLSSVGDGNLEVLEAEVMQSVEGVHRLVKGKPTVVRAQISNGMRMSGNVPVRLSWTDESGATTTEELSVPLRPGVNQVWLPRDKPFLPPAGTVSATLELDPAGVLDEVDESDNTWTGSKPVVETRPFDVLLVPVGAEGGASPTCTDLSGLAAGVRGYLRAAWPVDPTELHVVHECATVQRHPARKLDDFDLQEELVSALAELRHEGGYDLVVGVVPDGWAALHSADHPSAVGLAFTGSEQGAVLVERQSVGGWAVAHEGNHDMGWVTDGAEGQDHPANPTHLKKVAARGYVADGRMAVDSDDYMYSSAVGADLGNSTSRWLSPQTWEFTLDRLLAGGGAGLAAAASDHGPVLQLSGTVTPEGVVQAGPWRVEDGTPSPGAHGDGDLAVRFHDASGTVLGTSRVTSVELHATVHDHTGPASAGGRTFQAGLALPEGTSRVSVERGGQVVLERAVSAAPSVTVTAPVAGESWLVGQQRTIRWAAGDVDSTGLTASVSISRDGGRTWVPLAGRVTGQELTLTATPELAGRDVRVRVTVTDGLATARDVSDSFAVVADGTADRIFYLSQADLMSPVELWTTGADGSARQRMWADVYPSPRYSVLDVAATADGSRIAVVLWDRDTSRSVLVLADADGGNRTVVYERDGQLDRIDWAPDGRRLVLAGSPTVDGTWLDSGLYTMDVANGALSRVQGTPKYAKDPDWSGTGELIAYEAYTSVSGWDVFVVRPDGKGLRNLSGGFPSGRHEQEQAFSPDGRTLAVESDDGLHLVDVATAARTPLLLEPDYPNSSDDWITAPAWSPDGSRLVVSSNRDAWDSDADQDLFTIERDGTGLTELWDTPSTRERAQDWVAGPAPLPLPDPAPVVADAGGPYRVAEGTSVSLDATGSTGTGTITGARWDVDGDGRYDDADGLTASAAWPDEGTYEVAVQVRREDGLSDTDTAVVTVVNTAPEVFSAAAVRTAPDELLVTARVSDRGVDDAISATVVADQGVVPAALVKDGTQWLLTARVPATASASAARIEVVDGDGADDSAFTMVDSTVTNAPPTVRAMTLATTSGVPVITPVLGEDPEREPLEVAVVDPPASGTAVAAPGRLLPVDDALTYTPAAGFTGTDAFTYRVFDGVTWSAPAQVTVTVAPSGAEAPLVTAGPDVTGDEGTALPLAGSAPGTDAAQLRWTLKADTQVDPGAQCSITGTGASVTATCSDDGVWTARLEALAVDGTVLGSDEALITVGNAAPSVVLETPTADLDVQVGASVTVTATAVDAGSNDEVDLTVDAGDGSTPRSGGTAELSWAAPGTYALTVRATDDDGGSGEVARQVVVTSTSAVVDAGPDVLGPEGAALPLAGTVPGTGTTRWTVTAAPGTQTDATCTVAVPSAARTTLRCTDDGSFVAALEVVQGGEVVARDTTPVVVTNVAPSVALSSPLDGTTVLPGQAVEVRATVTDAGVDDAVETTIDPGDGSAVLTGTSGSVRYAEPGVYTLTVRAVDDDEAASTAQATVVVNDPTAKGTSVLGGGVVDGGHRVGFAAHRDRTTRGVLQLAGPTDSTSLSGRVTSLVVVGTGATMSGPAMWNKRPAQFEATVVDGGEAGPDTVHVLVRVDGQLVWSTGGPRRLHPGQALVKQR